MTEDKAQARVQQMLSSGQITPQEFEAIKRQAQSVMSLLGIK